MTTRSELWFSVPFLFLLSRDSCRFYHGTAMELAAAQTTAAMAGSVASTAALAALGGPPFGGMLLGQPQGLHALHRAMSLPINVHRGAHFMGGPGHGGSPHNSYDAFLGASLGAGNGGLSMSPGALAHHPPTWDPVAAAAFLTSHHAQQQQQVMGHHGSGAPGTPWANGQQQQQQQQQQTGLHGWQGAPGVGVNGGISAMHAGGPAAAAAALALAAAGGSSGGAGSLATLLAVQNAQIQQQQANAAILQISAGSQADQWAALQQQQLLQQMLLHGRQTGQMPSPSNGGGGGGGAGGGGAGMLSRTLSEISPAAMATAFTSNGVQYAGAMGGINGTGSGGSGGYANNQGGVDVSGHGHSTVAAGMVSGGTGGDVNGNGLVNSSGGLAASVALLRSQSVDSGGVSPYTVARGGNAESIASLLNGLSLSGEGARDGTGNGAGSMIGLVGRAGSMSGVQHLNGGYYGGGSIGVNVGVNGGINGGGGALSGSGSFGSTGNGMWGGFDGSGRNSPIDASRRTSFNASAPISAILTNNPSRLGESGGDGGAGLGSSFGSGLWEDKSGMGIFAGVKGSPRTSPDVNDHGHGHDRVNVHGAVHGAAHAGAHGVMHGADAGVGVASDTFFPAALGGKSEPGPGSAMYHGDDPGPRSVMGGYVGDENLLPLAGQELPSHRNYSLF
jgi:hypothetical protein